MRVYPSLRYHALLDQSPGQIGAPAVWGPGLEHGGRGIKIGIIDDGIDASHPFFDPAGFTAPAGFPRGDASLTTAKVIVARAFAPPDATWRYAGRPFDPVFSFHATHVAGIAAGDAGTVAPAAESRPRLEGLSGVAPLAFLGNYKALTVPTESGVGLNGNSPELVAAIEAAVADGMDVINLSLGEPEIEPGRDVVAKALDNAAAAGVVPVVAAGNSYLELGGGSVGSPGSAARAITVAAVTGSRYFGVAASVVGPAPVPPELASFGGAPPPEGIPESFGASDRTLVDVTALGAPATLCDPLAAGALAGSLALVREGRCGDDVKARNVRAAGGVGLVLALDAPGDPFFAPSVEVPVLLVSRATGETLAAFAATAPGGAIAVRIGSEPAELPSEEAGVVASFSSGGPTPLGLAPKPDVSAPGVDILSASPGGRFELLSGTSMATPHVAGAAALLRELHPDWTVEQLKSALVQTALAARASAERAAEADATREGGGLVDLPAAADPLLFASPQSLGFGLLDVSAGQQSVEATVALTDAGGGAGLWRVTVEEQEGGPGASLAVPAEIRVPGGLTVVATAVAGAAQAEHAGFVVLERAGGRRRIPFWFRVTRPALPGEPARVLHGPGVYRGSTAGRPARVDEYRYPDAPALVRRRLPGPEQVFRFAARRAPVNFGVAVVSAGQGVEVEPRIVRDADENRLLGPAALPFVGNPYLARFGERAKVAAALLPAPGTYSIVFDTPNAAAAGPFTFRFWVNDVTPPGVSLLSRAAHGGRVLARVRDAGSGVDPRGILYALDGGPWRQGRLDSRRGLAVLDVSGLSPGRHRLVLRVSDRQELKNDENVARILPNTRVVEATITTP